jgi:GTP-binding protein
MSDNLVKTAEFKGSFPSQEIMPAPTLLEFAFIGRSNVGKSSLINMLTGRHELALTSSTPGKTKMINMFLINQKWFVTDLPGYGYAKMGKKDRRVLAKIIENYLLTRQSLFCVFVLIDIRIPPQLIDLEFMEWLAENQIPMAMIFTKSDGLKPDAVQKAVETYNTKMFESWVELPMQFVSSSTTKAGREEILAFVKSGLAMKN